MKNLLRLASGISNKKRLLTGLLFVGALVFTSHSLCAQSRWQAAVRADANFPTEKLGPVDLKTGLGLEGSVAYRFMPHLSAVAGWGWNRFTPKTAGVYIDFEETGYVLGLQFVHPFEKSRLSYLLSAGPHYNHIEQEGKNGDILNDTGHGWGWQVEGGLSIPVSTRFSVQPSVRYRSLARDMQFDGGTAAVDLNFVSAGAAIVWSF